MVEHLATKYQKTRMDDDGQLDAKCQNSGWIFILKKRLWPIHLMPIIPTI
jgi:hypothetical protein